MYTHDKFPVMLPVLLDAPYNNLCYSHEHMPLKSTCAAISSVILELLLGHAISMAGRFRRLGIVGSLRLKWVRIDSEDMVRGIKGLLVVYVLHLVVLAAGSGSSEDIYIKTCGSEGGNKAK